MIAVGSRVLCLGNAQLHKFNSDGSVETFSTENKECFIKAMSFDTHRDVHCLIDLGDGWETWIPGYLLREIDEMPYELAISGNEIIALLCDSLKG